MDFVGWISANTWAIYAIPLVALAFGAAIGGDRPRDSRGY